MELHISGGVVSQDDISFLKKMVQEINPQKTPKIQIGTWGLIDLNLSNLSLDSSCAKDAASDGNGRPIIENCTRCSTPCKLQEVCNNGAIEYEPDGRSKINPAKCKKCKLCMSACHNVTLTTGLVKTDYEHPTKELNVEGFSWGGYKVDDSHKPDEEHVICKTVNELCIPDLENHRLTCPNCRVVKFCPNGALGRDEQNKLTFVNKSNCTGCLRCTENCWMNQNNCTGLTFTNAIRTTLTEHSKAIQPRIAFWLHDLCNGCGKCSRTFYCDSFLDRRGLDGPPTMDTRNCTGCGLCVQTCPQGAIQMFEPKHYAILLSNDDDALMNWHHFLTAEQIPHLVYTKEHLSTAWYYFAVQAWEYNTNNRDKALDVIQWRCEHDKCTEMYGKDGYKDERDAKAIHEALNNAPVNANALLTLWYSLALSDPGQILKDSPVILVDKNGAQVFSITSQSTTPDRSTETEKDSPKNENNDNSISIDDPASIRGCKALEEIRRDVVKRLSNLREEKR